MFISQLLFVRDSGMNPEFTILPSVLSILRSVLQRTIATHPTKEEDK